MARIVLGLGTSHSPMLSVPPATWAERVLADRREPRHFYNGRAYTFGQLQALRSTEDLSRQILPEVCEERHARCARAIDRLADLFGGLQPGVALIVGNDQMEVFEEGYIPSLAVFWGESVTGRPRTAEFLDRLPPGIAPAEADRTPPVETRYPCLPSLGRHLIEELGRGGFDVAQMTRLSEGAIGADTPPHAYGFVYRRIMRDRVPPHVPVFVNTFYPPNQPSAARCFAFGRALARAVSSWDDPRTVALIASGGLSHFVVDEAFDRRVIEMMRRSDGDALGALPESLFQSGTSEIKNWIVIAGAMSEAGFTMTLVDYVPCYRSEAGTGNAMGFASWF